MKSTDTEERSYVAFISYRHKELDREAAVRIQKKIENYVVPKEYREAAGGKKLGIVFRDEDELPASSSLSDSITYALDHTKFLIVICTPDLPLSKWCLQEISYFLKTHDRNHVLAVLADGTPEESFPAQLRFTYDEEGRELAEVEPLAANIAGENHTINNKAFKKEVVRLFAAIIGCPFDALWQRERRARTNRLIAAMGVGLSAMAVVIGIVLSKNAQISEQNAQILEQNDQIRQQVEQISEQKDQISEQNDQIKDQNVKLQQQMSQVLVDSGLMQLEAFDRDTALDYALEALESNDPAIYDHRAETLLASVLGTYANNSTRCFLLCEQNTEITQLTTAANGSILLTSDDFGTVRSYDTASGKLRWEFPLGVLETPRLYPVDAHDLVICKTSDICAALSLDDGSLIWSFSYQKASPFQVLSKDGSVFVVMDRGVENGTALFFLDTADGHVLHRTDVPCEGFQVRSTTVLDYYYEYAGDFSADMTRFVFALPMEVEAENEGEIRGTRFFAADLTDDSVQLIGSFPSEPDMILSLAYYEPEKSVYCSMSRGHLLYSMVFPLEPGKEVITEEYDYSLSSRSGFASYDYMFQEMPYLAPLNNDELSLVISRNVIYLMNLKDGRMRNTINLDSAIVYAEWIDTQEETFQVFTEGGWCLRYDVSHYDNKAIEGMTGWNTPVKGVQKASLIHGGPFINEQDGMFLVTRQDAPGQILLSRTISDGSLTMLEGRQSDVEPSYFTISPSGDRLMVFSKNDDNSTLVEYCDLGDMTWSTPVVLPFGVYYGAYSTALLMPDDDHIYFNGTLYGLDGSSTEMDEDFPDHVIFEDPSTTLLADGSLLCTCETWAPEDTSLFPKTSVLSCRLDNVPLEVCETVEGGLTLQNDEEHPHLYAVGENGWIGAWGNQVSFSEAHALQTAEEQTVVVKNLQTGEKFTPEDALTDIPVSRLIFAHSKPLLTVLYETGDIQILDLSKGGRSVLNTAYAYGELKFAAFSDLDDHLLILTEMNWLDCFDTATGEMVFSQGDALAIEDSGISALFAKEDTDNHRLIVWVEYGYTGNASAVILDEDAWVCTESVPDLIALSLKHRLVFLGTPAEPCVCPYYTIGEMIEQARGMQN